jgi:hypothetical protein
VRFQNVRDFGAFFFGEFGVDFAVASRVNHDGFALILQEIAVVR